MFRQAPAHRRRARAAATLALEIALLLVPAVTRTGVAQAQVADPMNRRAVATRQELDSLASLAEAAAGAAGVEPARRATLQRYAADIRTRLQQGDFQPGDRILISVAADSSLRDTFTVQPSGVLALRRIPPIPLAGVLRAELHPYLAQQLRQYVKDTLLRASPLVLIGVLGEVGRPGYYRVPLEIAVGDALMIAGGPTPQADLKRLTIRRGSSTIVPAPRVREAMVQGWTLGQLGLDAGDEMVVQAPRARNWPLLMQIGGLATGLLLGLHAVGVF